MRRGYPKDFKIGDLRHCIQVEKPVLTQNEIGGQEESWEEVFKGRAFVRPLSANQRLYANQLNHEISHKVIMRYCRGLKPEMRILFDERVLFIHGIIDVDSAGRFLEITCKEGTAS